MFNIKTFISFWLFLPTFYAFGQQKVVHSSDWVQYVKNSGVVIETRYADCNIPSEGIYAEYVLIRLKNESSEPLRVSLYTDTYYNGVCSNCEHNVRDRKREFVINPGATVEGECGIGSHQGLRVFSKWLKLPNQRELDFLQLTDINVSHVH